MKNSLRIRGLGQTALDLPARSVLAAELIEHGLVWPALGRWQRFRGLGRSLGDVCTVLQGGSRVCSPGTPQPLPGWVANAGLAPNPGSLWPPGSGWTPRYRPASPGLTQNQALAQAMSVYNTNPQNLTANQWALLQSAGVIPSTLPYSSAGQLATAAAAPTVAATTTTTDGGGILDFLGSIPWWGYAIAAGGAIFLMSGSGKRGRR